MNESLYSNLNSFFYCYKYYIDYIGTLENNYYTINIKKTKFNERLTKINISIKDTKYNRNSEDKIENNLLHFDNYIILPDDLASKLISNIINDFLDNHDVKYDSINNYKNELNLNNTFFTLSIKLTDKLDFSIADQIREKINCPKHKKIKSI